MQEGHKKGGLFLFFCLGLIAGVALFSFKIHYPNFSDIDFYIGQKAKIVGLVISEPKQKEKNQEFDISLISSSLNKETKGKLRVSANAYPKLNYGDLVELECLLEKAENKTFNYQKYLERYDIYAVCWRASFKKLDSNKGNFFKANLLLIKNKALGLIEKFIGEPESSLVGPVLFGGGDEVGDELVESFRRTGLTHIMAVSGFNVGILAAAISYFLFIFGLKRKTVFIVASLATTAYVVLVGAPASAVRAGIMSILLMLALALGRLAKLSSIVILTATITLIFNPKLLASDIGWQLSFAAVLGLIYIYPFFKKLFEKIFPKSFNILNDVISATLAAQVSTTPISLYHFGQISLIAPLANLLVVWTIPILTACAILGILLSAVFPQWGYIFFFPSWLLAKYIFFIVKNLSNLSWAIFSI